MSNVTPLVTNRSTPPTMGERFRRAMPWGQQPTKHDVYDDFGWIRDPSFVDFQSVYFRHSIASAGINKKVEKVWETNPLVRRGRESRPLTTEEEDINQHLSDIRLWNSLMEADRNALVGTYSGVLLRIADGRPLDQPINTSRLRRIEDLVDVVPFWANQLTVLETETDERSQSYGMPKMFQVIEDVSQSGHRTARRLRVHPDRVVVWSDNGRLTGNESALEPVLNDLITIQLIVGSGGEGFWKNAKSAPVLEIEKDGKLNQLAQMLGVDISELPDRLNKVVENWQRGFDELLMVQGMEAKTLGVTLPQPEEFHRIALMGVSAGLGIPMKIFVGTQTGERASTEDADEWAYTSMQRRLNKVVPNIRSILLRLERIGVLQGSGWQLKWDDLTESGASEKMNRAARMAETNDRTASALGEAAFSVGEIREAAGYAPLPSPIDALPAEGDQQDALGGYGDA